MPSTDATLTPELPGPGVLHDLGSLDGGESYPRAINDSGQVIGTSSFPSKRTCSPRTGCSTVSRSRAFLWQDGVMRNLGTLGNYSVPAAFNDLGHVVGSSDNHAFVWKDGHMSALPTVAECNYSTHAVDINNHDQIVGVCYASNGKGVHALLWTPRPSA